MSQVACEQCNCGWEDFDMVILPNFIWHQIASPKECICHRCIEERLGRKIDAMDFPKEPVAVYGGQRERVRKIICNQEFFATHDIVFKD